MALVSLAYGQRGGTEPSVQLGTIATPSGAVVAGPRSQSSTEKGISMELDALFDKARSDVIDEAADTLGRSRPAHYDKAGEEFTRQRLTALYDLVVTAIRSRDLAPVSAFAERVASERFDAGFDIAEVQLAFNVLEGAMWRRVVADVATPELPEAIGLLSTVLGFGKDALARAYVSLASRKHVPSLDLTALFSGVEA